MNFEIQNDLSGYINTYFINNTSIEENSINQIINEEEMNEENLEIGEEDIILEIGEEEINLEEDEETVVENFDEEQLNQDNDDETVSYGEDSQETVRLHPNITDEMKDSYCRFYIQHVYCYLKNMKDPDFDWVCENEYNGNIERCVMDYMMPFVLDSINFDGWLFDFAYRFDGSLNYLVHYLQEMERINLLNLLYEAIPPTR